MLRVCVPIVLVTFIVSAQTNPAEVYKQGHSHQGDAFDSGPRQKPWRMDGIGKVHFPITTKNAEVQEWFDQGVALLHSFWFYEAERSFRWCLKLEPGNPMAYWGLARSSNGERADDFIREALKRKDQVTERERLYIEAAAAAMLPDPLREPPDDYQERSRKSKQILETLCVKYPDDMEARAFLALESIGGDRYGTESIIREILARQPDHPGAHHYRIHNWDYHEPEQALASAQHYGEIVPSIGHALHMPGHIFSVVGMWNEAAISMDAATRAEKRYAKESLTFPFNNWNYGHNRFYLSYIQEQLGMPKAAMKGARELIDVPTDPKDNDDSQHTAHTFGIAAMARVLTRFQHWDDLLDGKHIPWREIPLDRINKPYFEARAWLGKGDLDKAEKALAAHTAAKKELEQLKPFTDMYNLQEKELKARFALARGETIRGLGMLAEAAQAEFEMQSRYADPPAYPESLYDSLGEAYLTAESPGLAALAFEKGLELTRMDLFALSGLVRAYAATGEREKAQEMMGRLLYVTADAESGLKPLELAKATGIEGTPHDSSPAPQRSYLRTSLEKFGPLIWEPYAAPLLDVQDSAGKPVTLDQYRGKNVMLIFYLGAECAHCMQQLHKIGEMADKWKNLDTELLAVSSASPADNQKALKSMGALPFRLLSDTDRANARRWHSYDDYEEIELHSTILIDKAGRVYWARFGGDPFSDIEFLSKTLVKMNELARGN
jgi:peroxiredoxin